MVDPSALLPWITPIITTVVTYIRTQAIQKTADKVTEAVSGKAAAEAMNTGEKALTFLRTHFFAKADEKAKRALADVEQDPDDEDYRKKLAKETARLASADPTFAQHLKALGGHITDAQAGSVTIESQGDNYGAIGVFHSPVHFNQRTAKDESR